MQPREIMRATESIYRSGAAFYFDEDTVSTGKDAGLDGFRFYILGRGGVLGDCDSAVVQSAFGYFHPGLIAKMWDSAREKMPPRDAARLYLECNHRLGRTVLAGVERLDAFVEAATQVIDAVEGVSLPMFVGVRAEPVPADPPAAALHQVMVLRELRGSVHLLALTAVGLHSSVAHAVKRPDDVSMFGYRDGVPEVTDADRGRWDQAEDLTDQLLEPAYASLSDEQADALIAGAAAIADALGSE